MRRALSATHSRSAARLNRPSLAIVTIRPLSTYTCYYRQSPRVARTPVALFRTPFLQSLHTERAEPVAEEPRLTPQKSILRQLPLQCAGCGAFSQTTDPTQAGYYDVQRRVIKEYLGLIKPRKEKEKENLAQEIKEDEVVAKALDNLSPEQLKALGLSRDELIPERPGQDEEPEVSSELPPPACERCRSLTYYNTAEPIFHPSLHSIGEIIEESPYKYNHVYHLIDAADFPMSLVPRLHQLIGEVNLRTQNRRSRKARFHGGRKIDMSFVITRSDLLAPTAGQVDALMPYLREVLREALGRVGRRVRLGNVSCVSANRGWWTANLKEEIYKRGGAGWLVGKANVGKSNLFGTVFPKGRMNAKDTEKSISITSRVRDELRALDSPPDSMIEKPTELNVGEWLPPARQETNFPVMPTVSALPGTTASPIRIPFGNGKGELIDLPGLARSDLEVHVRPEYRSCLVMRKRVKPTQDTIKPGQSLLLGGLIRITPRTPGLMFLAASFTPLETHVTSTSKAVGIQEQEGDLKVQNIAVPGTGEKIRCAGSFTLRYDVTRERAGPLTRKDALRFNPETLPFRVLAVDILIEGVGWIEIAVQVRKRDYPYESGLAEKPGRIRGAEDEHVEEKADAEVDVEVEKDPWAALEEATTDKKGQPMMPPERKKPFTDALEEKKKKAAEEKEDEERWPVIDVFTPEGRFIGSRRPMNGYMLNKVREKPAKNMRRSMRGAKKRDKMARRAGRNE